MAKKRRLSLQEHRDLGQELKSIRDRLISLTVLIDGAYPRYVSAFCGKAADSLDTLRSELDARVFWENQAGYPEDRKNELLRVYYPGNRGER